MIRLKDLSEYDKTEIISLLIFKEMVKEQLTSDKKYGILKEREKEVLK